MTQSRPVYETKSTVAVEKAMAAWIEPIWNCKVVKLPRAYNLDFAALRENRIVAWLELKRRYRALTEYPTVFLSLQKVLAGKKLWEISGMPCFLVIQFDDCYAYTDMLCDRQFEFRGRIDRGDPEDQEPVVVILVEQFKKLGTGLRRANQWVR